MQLATSFSSAENPSEGPSKDQPSALTSANERSRYFWKKVILSGTNGGNFGRPGELRDDRHAITSRRDNREKLDDATVTKKYGEKGEIG